MIVTVHEECLRHRLSDEFGHFGKLAILNIHPELLKRVRSAVKQTNVDRLLAIHFISKHAEALAYLETCDHTILVRELILDLVGTLGAQPLVGPSIQIQISAFNSLVVAFLQGADEVNKRSVSPLELLEIDLDASGESIPTHQKDQLLEQAGTLSVCDTVDERLRDVGVRAVSFDVVVRRSQIILQTPALVVGEMKPRLALEVFHKVATGSACVVTEGRSKALIKPKIVPPLHGDKVTEPHMRQLVLHDNAEEGQLRVAHMLTAAHNGVTVSDAAHVFHSTVLVVRAHDVIDLAEGVPLTEMLLIVVNRCFCDAKEQLVAQVDEERLTNIDTLRRVHGVVIFKHFVRAGAHCIQVSRDPGRLLKLIRCNFAVTVEIEEPTAVKFFENTLTIGVSIFVSCVDAVRYGAPLLRARHAQRHLGFETGLIE